MSSYDFAQPIGNMSDHSTILHLGLFLAKLAITVRNAYHRRAAVNLGSIACDRLILLRRIRCIS